MPLSIKKIIPILFAFIAGALLPFSFAPFAFWPLAIVSPLCYLLLLEFAQKHNGSTSNNPTLALLLKLSFAYWFGFYVFGVSWVYVSIHEYGYTPAPLATLLALCFALGLALVNLMQNYLYLRLKLQNFVLVSFPALWVLMEWFRSWFLSGFPWLYTGYAFIDSPLASLAPIGGVYLLSFVSIFFSCVLFIIVKFTFNKKKTLKDKLLFSFSISASVLLITTALLLKETSWVTDKKEDKLLVHLVQGNIAQHEKWLPKNQRKILYTYNDLIFESLKDIESSYPDSAHLIILPEAAMPTLQSDLAWFFDNIDQKAKQQNTAVISGIFYDENAKGFLSENIYNSILVVGQGSGLYHKQRLVPFGEYVPLEGFIRGWIPFFDLPFSSFTRGSRNQAGLLAFDFTIAPFICYEILYPELVFKHAQNADLLLTISNDAWFGNSSGPEQHFQMARMRALELGKYLIRTTNTGTTAIIDPQGRVQKQLPKNTRDILNAQVFKTQGHTPFSQLGNSPILLLCTCILILCLVLTHCSRVKTKALGTSE